MNSIETACMPAARNRFLVGLVAESRMWSCAMLRALRSAHRIALCRGWLLSRACGAVLCYARSGESSVVPPTRPGRLCACVCAAWRRHPLPLSIKIIYSVGCGVIFSRKACDFFPDAFGRLLKKKAPTKTFTVHFVAFTAHCL